MSENHIEIEASQCKGCRLCVEACSRNCIIVGSSMNQKGYQYAQFTPGKCIACGFCYYICPEPGAITVYKKEGK